MDTIARLFDLMDAWRLHPKYQLERRADLFFAAYLPAFLSHHYGFAFREELIPEFPLARPDQIDWLSNNADYLALSLDGKLAVFVELKTEMASLHDAQHAYLSAAKTAGLQVAVERVIGIFRSVKREARLKYYALLKALERAGLVRVSAEVDRLMTLASHRGLSACAVEATAAAGAARVEVLYLQPRTAQPESVGFGTFADWLQNDSGAVARRFAESLRRWATPVSRP